MTISVTAFDMSERRSSGANEGGSGGRGAHHAGPESGTTVHTGPVAG